jgi:hypothetical protein
MRAKSKTYKGDNMKLSIAEKVLLTQSMPYSGSISMMKRISEILPKIKEDPEELRKKYCDKNGNVNDTIIAQMFDHIKEIPFTKEEENTIKQILFEMSKQNKITLDHLPLCEKFGVDG